VEELAEHLTLQQAESVRTAVNEAVSSAFEDVERKCGQIAALTRNTVPPCPTHQSGVEVAGGGLASRAAPGEIYEVLGLNARLEKLSVELESKLMTRFDRKIAFLESRKSKPAGELGAAAMVNKL
jgi:hypothetical protein